MCSYNGLSVNAILSDYDICFGKGGGTKKINFAGRAD